MTARILAERFLSKYPARWVALKYIEGDEEVKARGRAAGPLSAELETMAQKLDAHCLATLGVNADALVSDARWGYVAGLVRQGVVREDGIHQRRVVSERLDAVLTQRLLGPLVMLAILYGLFEIVFALGETPAGWLEGLFGWASGAVEAAMPDGLLRSLIVSGLIDGVGGVLGFTPYSPDHVLRHRRARGLGLHGPHGLHARPGLSQLRPARQLGHALHRLRRHRRRLRRARGHGHPHAARQEREDRHAHHRPVHELRGEAPGLPAAGGGLLLRLAGPDAVRHHARRLGPWPSSWPSSCAGRS